MFDLVELQRRVANLIRIGAIETVDTTVARASVQIGTITTAALPWLTSRAGDDRTWWSPSVGEQVVVLSVGGDLAQGVILPAIYSNTAPAPANAGNIHRTTYADGATISYDTAAHTLTAEIPGDVTLTATGDVTVNASGNATVNSQGKAVVTASADVEITSATTARITAPNVQIVATQTGSGAAEMTGSFKLIGDFDIIGNVEINGNAHATGTIIDDAGNTPNHTH